MQSTVLPRFTPHGFEVVKAPRGLWKRTRANYRQNKRTTERESFDGNKFFTDPEHIPRIIRNAEQRRLNAEVTDALKPLLEEWSRVKLIPTSTYGVRVYGNGSTLYNHCDIPDTHIISAIFHIDHDLDEPWPLEIEDHDGAIHEVSPEPGEIVFYESATQYHSRLTPLRGRDYGSVFVHFKPVGWSWTRMDMVAAVPPDSGEAKPEDPDRHAIFGLGLPPLKRYIRQYYKDRGLPLLDFYGHDRLALPVQNAAMMVEVVPHAEL